MAEAPITLEKEGSISIITVDDGKANAFNVAMTSALSDALDEVDVKTGAVIIRGREGIYSGGYDLNVIKQQDPKATRAMTLGGVNVALKVFDFPRPVIAAVTGHAIAMGAIFNMGIDWRIGARGPFKHGLNEIRAGLVLPAFAIELPRFRLNPMMFQEAAFQSVLYNPEDAIIAGFLDAVAEPGELLDAAMERATDLATLPNPAYGVSKKRDRARVKQYVSETLIADLDAIPGDAAPLR